MSMVLKDGTVLPDLPDGCFDGTPYGMIVGVDWMGNGEMLYQACYATMPCLALPVDLIPEDYGITPTDGTTHLLAFQPCDSKSWNIEGNAWVGGGRDTSTELGISLGVSIALWANHDFIEVDSLNADDMSYTVGSAVVRKSDVNYRITEGWMRSIADEARRLGGGAGLLTPQQIEAALRTAAV